MPLRNLGNVVICSTHVISLHENTEYVYEYLCICILNRFLDILIEINLFFKRESSHNYLNIKRLTITYMQIAFKGVGI